ncbi:MAG: hypothetical protein OXU79_18490 [Gemmatimonadota bacterium]|nr:hypothetical protein [Gemmatimonadota bacterium]
MLIFFLGSAGLGAELLLLEHFTEWRQQVPLALLGLGLILMVTHLVYKRRVVVRLFRLTMLAFVLGGIVGVWIHFDANMAFELEMYSKLSGWYLITRAAHGALPVLAPGALIQLGLIGLLYAYRHPGLGAGQSEVD